MVHVETHTKQLEPRAWGRFLVGCSTDSKSYRAYNPATKRVRECRHVIFIETTSALTRVEVGGFDDGKFTYDVSDGLARDVREYTSNQEIGSPSPTLDAAEPLVSDRLGKLRDVTHRDLRMSPAAPTPTVSPGGVSPSGQSSPSPGPPMSASSSGFTPSGDAPGGSSRGGSSCGGSSRGGSSRGGFASHGGRAITPAVTISAASQPNARTLSERRRLRFA